MSTILNLPVSIGEAIDKLSILDIKNEKITDKRKKDVKNEYDLLYDNLKEFIIKYESLYKTMKKVNLLIWDMMDLLRDGDLNDGLYLKICRECVEFNDIRFRVKNKINYLSKSFLKEQKSYKVNRLVITIKQDIKDILLLDIIKYFSFIYDEIIIESSQSLSYLRDFFHYDIDIIFTADTETEYKTKVQLENEQYFGDELYNLFNISFNDLNKVI